MVIAVLSKAQLFTESFSTYTVGSNLTTNSWSQCASGTVPLTINGTNLTYQDIILPTPIIPYILILQHLTMVVIVKHGLV